MAAQLQKENLARAGLLDFMFETITSAKETQNILMITGHWAEFLVMTSYYSNHHLLTLKKDHRNKYNNLEEKIVMQLGPENIDEDGNFKELT